MLKFRYLGYLLELKVGENISRVLVLNVERWKLLTLIEFEIYTTFIPTKSFTAAFISIG